MGAVFAVLLEGIDGNDRLVEVVERVVVGGDLASHPLEAEAIEAGEREGEAGPKFLLELGEHGFHRYDEDAASPSSLDELREEDAAFDCFPEADGIGNENALAGLRKRQSGGLQLEGEDVHGSFVAQVERSGFRGGRTEM